jgi:hypothetical protein
MTNFLRQPAQFSGEAETSFRAASDKSDSAALF